MIVCRPNTGERQIIETGVLDLVQGLLGDNWKARGSSSTADGSADPERQLTVMNARVVALVAQNRSRWPLAGDQLYIDLDLSENNLPVGSRFALGSAVIEVTAPPHTGCKKFVARFGLPAMNFVNSSQGRQLHLRGINARIVKAGTIRVGDVATKL
jgi:MOSC domain-containing protein YiiM